jgi:hypothetical protein
MIVALTFTICLAAQCEQDVMFQRAAGIGEARACRMAYDFARSRAHPEATFRDVECKAMEKQR